MKPRAITGLGIVSTLGIGREAFFQAMTAPVVRSVAHRVETFDPSTYPGASVAEVEGFDAAKYLGEKGLRTLDRLTKLLVVAARLALHDAGIKKDGAFVYASPERVGLVCSNAYGSLEAITELDRVATLEDARYINPAKFPNTVSNSAAGYVSIWEELRAINVTVSDGNCGALDAIACAEYFLATDRADALLVGGAEAMSEALYLAFRKLGALAEGGPRIGEGAVLLVTELPALAAKRGAHIFGHVLGYGTAFVAPEREVGGSHPAPLIHASAEAMERAIQGALTDAAVTADAIDLVASGISGLRVFDEAELAGIDAVLGAAKPVATPKAILGETLGAGGGMAMASALAWFSGCAPTPLLPRASGASSLRPNEVKEVRTVLVTSMGYYGNASAVVLRAPAPPELTAR